MRCSGRPEFEYAEYDIRDLTHEKDRLQQWMWTVPRRRRSTRTPSQPKEVTTAEAAANCARSRPRPGSPDVAPAPGPPRITQPAAEPPAHGCDVTVVEVLFCLLGAMAVGSALLVALSANLVHCALWLVVTLGALAGLYLLLAAEFVAWVQVLIYVGAVVVLLLFALMLTRAPIGVLADLDGTGRVLAGVVATATAPCS